MKNGSARAVVSLVLALATLPAVALSASLQADIVNELTAVEKKLVGLAEATPAEKYGWRPAEGVRSVSEVYMHVVGANFMLPTMIGAKMPEGITRDMEKTVTEKAKVVDALKKSFEHTRKAVAAVPDADLDKKVKFFGTEKAERELLMILLNHAHEHLGQSIAYARMNGVAPPWSEGPPPAPEKKAAALKS
ncbi:MAG: DinB family protein [Acidobacteriota bacterium]|nr:DinB family protein [Acidobacteriota bacterium]